MTNHLILFTFLKNMANAMAYSWAYPFHYLSLLGDRTLCS